MWGKNKNVHQRAASTRHHCLQQETTHSDNNTDHERPQSHSSTVVITATAALAHTTLLVVAPIPGTPASALDRGESTVLRRRRVGGVRHHAGFRGESPLNTQP